MTNGSNATVTSEPSELPASIKTILGLSLSLIIVFALFLNLTACTVMFRTPHLRSRIHTIFIVNLCFADLATILFSTPFTLMSIFAGDNILKENYSICALNGCLVVIAIGSSTNGLLVISLDRFLAINYPLKYKKMVTRTRALIVSVLVWVFGILTVIPPAAGWPGFHYHEGNYHCSPNWQHCGYYMIILVIGLAIPICIMLVSYAFIYRELKKQGIQLHGFSSSAVSPSTIGHSTITAVCEDGNSLSRNQRQFIEAEDVSTISQAPIRPRTRTRPTNNRVASRVEKKIAVMGAILIAAYLACWTPYALVNSCSLRSFIEFPRGVQTSAMWLAYFNSVANPIVYSWTNLEIRRQIKSYCRCK